MSTERQRAVSSDGATADAAPPPAGQDVVADPDDDEAPVARPVGPPGMSPPESITGHTDLDGRPFLESARISPDGAQADPLLRGRLFDPPPRPGAIAALDRYEVVRILATGRSSLVVLARHPVADEFVAIKVLRPEKVGDEAAVRQFLAEARHIQYLSHSHVLPVVEVADRAEGPYCVMAYLERGSLAGLLEQGKPMDPPSVTTVALGVAEALAYAHGRGVVHRDLRPGNILLDGDGRAYVTGFALARALYSDSTVATRQAGTAEAAPYASPAVAAGEPEDTRCDVYALGAVIYHMLTGRAPYTGAEAPEVIAQVRAGPPAPILSVNPNAPAGLVRIAEGAMARSPAERYPRMEDMAEDLRRVALGQRPLGSGRTGFRWLRWWSGSTR